MVLAVVLLLIVVLTIVILLFLSNKNLKYYCIGIFVLTILVTVGICFKIPKMHNPMSFQVVDYLIKFENTGDITITKQTTSTKYERSGEINK